MCLGPDVGRGTSRPPMSWVWASACAGSYAEPPEQVREERLEQVMGRGRVSKFGGAEAGVGDVIQHRRKRSAAQHAIGLERHVILIVDRRGPW